MSKPYVALTPYHPSHPHVLAIYCSDGRFTDAVEELASHLGHGALGEQFIAEQQLKDLHEAASELRKAHPGLSVHTYMVRPDGTRIHFEPLSSS